MPINRAKAFARELAARASRIVRVRWMAARVLLWEWMAHPPGPSNLAKTLRRARRTLAQSGPRELLRDINARTHALARDGSKLVYAGWINSFDRLSDTDIVAIQKATTQLAYRPLLSVLMPVYNTDERWLRAAIESVQNQLYSEWELCIADDCSTNGRVRELLREIAAKDRRIKLVFRQVNGHISAASNSALALASGEFVVLLDHDDVLPRQALLAVVCELNRHPDADILYSDEDKIDEKGRRFDPYFKSDWNPELFYGQNMISHLGVYRREIMERVGGFREGYEGSQDYDLALRVVEHTQPRKIRHIPHILYHWRAIPGSAALAPDEKTYARAAARRAVQEHFDRIGLRAMCEPAPRAPSHHRIRYCLPAALPHVTIIIPTRDRVDLLSRCVESIRSRSTYKAFDILIIDNGSSTPEFQAYSERARRDSRISILRIDEPFNFSRLNNLGAAQARGELLCFLNNDTEVISPDWLEEMVSLAGREEIGAVGATLYHPDDTIQHAGITLGLGGIAAHRYRGLPRGEAGTAGLLALTQAVSAVSAACLMVRKSVFDEVGGFDEALAVAYNDVDFCLRLGGRGLRNVWTPFAELYHFESATRGADVRGEARTRLLAEAQAVRQRWRGVLGADPYFNPNLSLERPDFALAYPPRHTASWWQVGAGDLY
jgi:GT2 family glycosyltransferase